ncbi:SIS domain-containing protein [Thalassospira sp. MA62]|nr:SIS domain-containing protein [Thalassospira sp. MA62]
MNMMLREILAQAEILPDLFDKITKDTAKLAPAKGRIFSGGCGDCAFASGALSELFDAFGVDVQAKTAMELAAFTKFNADDTVILSSISGGTKRTVDAANAARKAGARVIAITCNPQSALAQASDDTIALPYVPLSRKTPHTLDYGVVLVVLADVVGKISGGSVPDLKPLIAKLADLTETVQAPASTLAKTYNPAGKVFFLGAGPDLATAEYTAAKFHEAGGLIAIAAETENFVHGMNFMLEPDDTVFILASGAASAKRGKEVASAFKDICKTHVIAVDDLDQDGVAGAFTRLFDITLRIQFLCCATFAGLGLELEAPRAGRPDGDAHMAAQSQAMSS